MLSILALADVCGAQGVPEPAQQELARAVHETDALLQQLREIRQRIESTLQHARGAQVAARAAGSVALEAAAVELERHASALEKAIADVSDGLRSAHEAASRLAPSEVVAALQAARGRFDAAGRERDLEDAESGFLAVAKELEAPLFAGADAATALRGRALFHAAESKRRRAALWLRSGDNVARALKLLETAKKEYEALLDGPDIGGVEEGSSLKAVARYRVVMTEGCFYEYFIRFRNDPARWRTLSAKASSCRENAMKVFDELSRIDGAETLPNGALVLDVVRQDIENLFR